MFASLLLVLALQDVQTVLENMRQTLGRPELQAGEAWAWHGPAFVLGRPSRATLTFVGSKRWVSSNQTEDLSRHAGRLDDTLWELDWTGTPRRPALSESTTAALRFEFLTGCFLYRSPQPDWTYEETKGGVKLMATLDDCPVTIEVRKDSVIEDITWDRGGTEASIHFASWEATEQGLFPTRLLEQNTGNPGWTEFDTFERVTPEVGAFEPRLDLPLDTEYDSDISPHLEVRRAKSGHLLVPASLDGHQFEYFIFDSGAGTNCIDRDFAQSFGMSAFGMIRANGVGGAVNTTLYEADSLQVGPVVIDRPIFLELDLSGLSATMGFELKGILGYELLSRCRVQLDYTEPSIALYDPEEQGPPDVRWQDLLLYDRHPCVEAAFEDHHGWFKIDTGATGTVSIHAPAVESLKLLEGRDVQDAAAGGVGGMVATKLGKVDWFELGGHRFEFPQIEFALEHKGAFADVQTLGNIGGGFLEPFHLFLDYPNAKVGFRDKASR